MRDEFEPLIQELTASQTPLYGYILSLLPDRTAAQDILQEVNMTVWQKRSDFEPGTSFFAWASKIAYFHVLSYRRRLRRDRLVLDDDVLDYLAERQLEREGELDSRAKALKRCLEKLQLDQRQLLEARYRPKGSVQQMADATGRTVGSISQHLYRIRQALMQCIEKTLMSEGLA